MRGVGGRGRLWTIFGLRVGVAKPRGARTTQLLVRVVGAPLLVLFLLARRGGFVRAMPEVPRGSDDDDVDDDDDDDDEAPPLGPKPLKISPRTLSGLLSGALGMQF